jgi:hypothetical protein
MRARRSVILLRALLQAGKGILQWREIQKWHWRVGRRHHISLGRIEVSDESFVRDATVLFFSLFAHVVGEFADFADVSPDRVSEVGEGIRQHVSVGEPQHRAAPSLRQRDAISEIRIAKPRVVIERIVDRVVDAAGLAFAAIAEVK